MFKGGKAEFWFVLTAENLMWFKDDEVNLYIYIYIYIWILDRCKFKNDFMASDEIWRVHSVMPTDKICFVRCRSEFSNRSLAMKCLESINRMTQRCWVTSIRRPLGLGQTGPQAVTWPRCSRHDRSLWLAEGSGQAVAAAAEDAGWPQIRCKYRCRYCVDTVHGRRGLWVTGTVISAVSDEGT